jgi:hypothetical protein
MSEQPAWQPKGDPRVHPAPPFWWETPLFVLLCLAVYGPIIGYCAFKIVTHHG